MTDLGGESLAAERVARAVAAATNLIYAGTPICVLGTGAASRRLSEMLRGFGARVHEVSVDENGRIGQRQAGLPLIEMLFVCDPIEGERPDAAQQLPDLREILSADWLADGAIIVDAGVTALLEQLGAVADEQAEVHKKEVRPGVQLVYGAGFSRFLVRVQPSELPRTGPVSPSTRSVDGAPSPSTAPETSAVARGVARIDWARRFMRTTIRLADDLAATGLLRGRRIGVSLVLEPKTAVLALALAQAGGEVAVFANAGETDGEVAAALETLGITVFAAADAGADGDARHAAEILDWAPQLLIDDGAHLVRLAHTEHPAALDTLLGAAEETTSGVRPLREMAAEGALRLPVIAVNDARTKTLFDNVHGTGQSCVLAIADLLDAADVRGGAVRGGRWVVVGYGPVGVGVARHAAAMGASVTVVERDPVRALGALYDGYEVDTLAQAIVSADVVVSATGHAHTITVDALTEAADGCVFAVAGGVENEIDVDLALARGFRRTPVLPYVERLHRPDGGELVLLAGGDGVNYTAGEGNPIEIMDLSFATQILALRMLLDSVDSSGRSVLATGVYELRAEGERAVAQAALSARGVATEAWNAVKGAGNGGGWREHRYRRTGVGESGEHPPVPSGAEPPASGAKMDQ
ncbi:adenosylhomocysteinase [Homoserinimonas aerilata]|nr:adenosylhomocysteinase [Homoserinimonas aerilata]